MRLYSAYILASRRNGTLYTGMTNDLVGRTVQHKLGLNDGFTKKYHVHKLVWFEQYANVWDAIAREKQIKKWNRAWKIALIEKQNPNWTDLFWGLVEPQTGAEIRARLRDLEHRPCTATKC
jgi:putative endonuclease